VAWLLGWRSGTHRMHVRPSKKRFLIFIASAFFFLYSLAELAVVVFLESQIRGQNPETREAIRRGTYATLVAVNALGCLFVVLSSEKFLYNIVQASSLGPALFMRKIVWLLFFGSTYLGNWALLLSDVAKTVSFCGRTFKCKRAEQQDCGN
jgi:hypothetical protein